MMASSSIYTRALTLANVLLFFFLAHGRDAEHRDVQQICKLVPGRENTFLYRTHSIQNMFCREHNLCRVAGARSLYGTGKRDLV